MADRPQVGEAVQRVFAERGVEMSIEESRQFVESMVGLISRGLIAPVGSDDEATDSEDEG